MKGWGIYMIRKATVIVVTVLMSILVTACGGSAGKPEARNKPNDTQTKVAGASPATTQQKSEEPSQSAVNGKKILVVYFSHSGNTRELAEQIQKGAGGDIVEILAATPYPGDYDTVVKQAKQEVDSGFKPAIKTKIDNLKSYDVIFVGSPNWWSTIAPPIATFLTENDLSGKTIVPFITHAGSGLGRSVADIKKLSPQSTVLAGLAVWGRDVGSSQDKVSGWLKDLKL